MTVALADPPLRLPVLGMPSTRADCLDGGSNAARPCEWTRCKYHLEPERAPRQANQAPATSTGESCSLDIADRGPVTLAEIGAALGLTRERARQIEAAALRRFAERVGRMGVIAPDEVLRALDALAGRLRDARALTARERRRTRP